MKLFNDWLKNWRTNLDDGCLKVYKELYEMDKSDLNHCLKFLNSYQAYERLTGKLSTKNIERDSSLHIALLQL